MIQSDNGLSSHNKNTKMIHPFDTLCGELDIIHKLIRPRTPRHNGKVERSHRNDNNRFYSTLKFYNYNDLIKQMKALSNSIKQYLQFFNRVAHTFTKKRTINYERNDCLNDINKSLFFF